MLDEKNRTLFLQKLTNQLGRTAKSTPPPVPKQTSEHPTTRFTQLSLDALSSMFIKNASALQVDCYECNEKDIADVLIKVCEKYGGNNIIIDTDSRLDEYSLYSALHMYYETYAWQINEQQQNIEQAKKANIGISLAEFGIAEFGGVVLYHDSEHGRSISLLPEKSIILVKKSTLLPRIAQLAEQLEKEKNRPLPSSINIISGPSSTSDIELIKVFGVHGPTVQVYILIDDLI